MIPTVDFRIGCECPACKYALMLWFDDERTHPRGAWTLWWERWLESPWTQDRPCTWQLRRFRRPIGS